MKKKTHDTISITAMANFAPPISSQESHSPTAHRPCIHISPTK